MKKVIISPSVIPGSGMGLFAEENIKRGDLIVAVAGTRYSGIEVEELEDSVYLLDSGDGSDECIDVRGPAMYANDACGLSRIPGLVNNSLFRLLDDGTMWLEATRTIRAGQEIFASYGRPYWTAIRTWSKLQESEAAPL